MNGHQSDFKNLSFTEVRSKEKSLFMEDKPIVNSSLYFILFQNCFV